MDLYNRVVALWQSYDITSPADIDKYLDSFHILFAFHSGKIENDEITYHDTREIFEHGKVTNFTGSARTLFEQQNQKLCYEYLKERIVRKEPLSIELIKEMHYILTGGTYDERRFIVNGERPGEFKKHDYVTGFYEVGSATRDVEQHLSELVAELNDYTGNDSLKAAAYLHARFEYIHPFADGNGRVGRTLMNYYLMTRNHPPIIIHNENKRLYFECLQKYDVDEEIEPLYQHLRYETERTWGKAMALVEGTAPKRKRLLDQEV